MQTGKEPPEGVEDRYDLRRVSKPMCRNRSPDQWHIKEQVKIENEKLAMGGSEKQVTTENNESFCLVAYID